MNEYTDTNGHPEIGYPEPDVIVIDEKTDMNQIHKQVGTRRNLIGMCIFRTEKEFEDWQKKSPREIYEITPTSLYISTDIVYRIFVTYNAGIIS